MDLSELKQITQNFESELHVAQEGKESSLSWLLHQVPQLSIAKDGEVFQVLVIGGSVCRNGLMMKKGMAIELLEHEKRDQPVFASKEVFLDFVCSTLLPNINVLALNMAYALSPVFDDNKLDGVLVAGAKEHTFQGLIGEQIGKQIEDYVMKKLGRKISVSVANDTVCLLLSGLTLHPSDSLACGIVGTGMNAALFLDSSNLVNLEAANFNKFKPTEEGAIIDSESVSPGKWTYEKETAGAYLYKHFNLYIKAHNINYPPLESTYDLKLLALHEDGEVSQIARILIKRSASLVACMIAGITEFKKRDMIFVMDGSFFWERDIYKNYVEEYIKQLTSYNVSFIQIEDTTLYGAAKLVC